MAGLEGSGKTTILHKLKIGEPVGTIPTEGDNLEQIEYKHFKFDIWDIPANSTAENMLNDYLEGVSALIYVVDANARDVGQ